MDLFAVHPDGVIYSAWWNGSPRWKGEPWNDWYWIGGQGFGQGTPIAALSRNRDQIDLFAVGLDGGVYSAWWNCYPWYGWFRIGGRVFPQQTSIAALSRNRRQIDLFAVGDDGGVYRAWWNGKPWWNNPWRKSNPWHDWSRVGGRVFPEGTPMAALSRKPDQMDLFAVGGDGGVCSASWNGTWRDWFRVGGRVFPEGTPMAALSRKPDQMDLFAVGGDGGVYGASWNGTWSDWFRLPLDATG
ncbi:MAG: hypothetical protein ACRDZ4_10775 [Egibacteraceae bacterium]